MNEQENFDGETALDMLLNYMRLLPKPTIKRLNFKRYQEMMQSAYSLQQLIAGATSSKGVTVEIHQDFNLGAISIELPDLCVMHPQKFSRIVNTADNFEIYPLTNGNLRIDVTFQNIIKGYYGEERL